MRQEIQDLLAKKDFLEGLLKLDDPSKVKSFFETDGNLKDVTDDEIKELGLNLDNLMQSIAKLPEDKLEKIGGGAPGVNLANPDGKGGYKNIWEIPKELKIAGGAAASVGIIVAGVKMYKTGQNKGWWDRFKRK